MSTIIRKNILSGTPVSITGDLTITDGDVVVATQGKGFVAKDNVTDEMRIVPFDDSGTKTLEVEHA
jgi:hypothetical protein